MFEIEKLQKYKIPYCAVYGRCGDLVHVSFPTPAHSYNESLRWVRRVCPALYYKATGECRERPHGYSWVRKPRPIKRRERLVWQQTVYADIYSWHADDICKPWHKVIERKPVIDKNVTLTTDEAESLRQYERIYVDYIAEMKSTRIPMRRLSATR